MPQIPRASTVRHRLSSTVERVPRAWRLPLAVLTGTQLIWLVWWAAFYPGLISFDSVMYTWQVTTGNWASDHSVLYDCFVWLALHLPGQFALLTLLQTTAMSATLAYGAVAMRGLGVPARWSAGAALAVAALPPTGTFVVFVWKDVPFTISAVLVFAAGARLVGRRFAGTLSSAGAPGLRPGTPASICWCSLWACSASPCSATPTSAWCCSPGSPWCSCCRGCASRSAS